MIKMIVFSALSVIYYFAAVIVASQLFTGRSGASWSDVTAMSVAAALCAFAASDEWGDRE